MYFSIFLNINSGIMYPFGAGGKKMHQKREEEGKDGPAKVEEKMGKGMEGWV